MIDGAPGLWAGLNAVSYIEVTNEPEARAAVRRVVRDGADFVKVYSRLSPEAYFAIVDEARRQQVPFAGHCPDNVPITEASQAGQLSLEHMWGTWYSTSSREAEIRRAIAEVRIEPGDYNSWFNQVPPLNWLAAHSYHPGKAAAVFAGFVANQSRQVPTLIAMRAIAMPDEVSRSDERLKYLPASTAEEWWWALDELFAAGRVRPRLPSTGSSSTASSGWLTRCAGPGCRCWRAPTAPRRGAFPGSPCTMSWRCSCGRVSPPCRRSKRRLSSRPGSSAGRTTMGRSAAAT